VANKYQPHVVVLVEDEANRYIVNGFQRGAGVRQRAIEVLPEAGGWTHVRDQFARELVPYLRAYPMALALLLVDFDQDGDRKAQVLGALDPALADRVFVVGTWSEPEALRRELGRFERIGELLFEDCVAGTTKAWDHPLLRHNASELERLNRVVRPVIFPTS
jgi:hypothetical protein